MIKSPGHNFKLFIHYFKYYYYILKSKFLSYQSKCYIDYNTLVHTYLKISDYIIRICYITSAYLYVVCISFINQQILQQYKTNTLISSSYNEQYIFILTKKILGKIFILMTRNDYKFRQTEAICFVLQRTLYCNRRVCKVNTLRYIFFSKIPELQNKIH